MNFPLSEFTWFVDLARGNATFTLAKALKAAAKIFEWVSGIVPNDDEVIARSTEYDETRAVAEVENLIASHQGGTGAQAAMNIDWMLVIQLILKALQR